jgi:hypothetical protein
MTNSKRGRYDTAFFIIDLARMKRRPHPCKGRTCDSVTRRSGPGKTRSQCGKRAKKEPPEGGSRFSQGGVKQSGQEPLNVQKLDSLHNGEETLTYG